MPTMKITLEGVLRLLKDLDEALAKIMKLAADEVTPALTLIFSNYLSIRVVQLDWLIANIYPTFKMEIGIGVRNNYRPI